MLTPTQMGGSTAGPTPPGGALDRVPEKFGSAMRFSQAGYQRYGLGRASQGRGEPTSIQCWLGPRICIGKGRAFGLASADRSTRWSALPVPCKWWRSGQRPLVDGRDGFEGRYLVRKGFASLNPPGATGRRKRCGEVAEWLKAHAWNACIRETVSRVRIPFSPPSCFALRASQDWQARLCEAGCPPKL